LKITGLTGLPVGTASVYVDISPGQDKTIACSWASLTDGETELTFQLKIPAGSTGSYYFDAANPNWTGSGGATIILNFMDTDNTTLGQYFYSKGQTIPADRLTGIEWFYFTEALSIIDFDQFAEPGA
jgi:hypothetical protein